MNSRVLRIVFASLVTLLSVLPVAARGRAESDDLLPFNDRVERGTFANGMDYFLLRHGYPEGRVVLRLVVNAGSILETDDQRGLAHYLEHMAFNGTERFGENELVGFLESLGAGFGPDVNAYTGFDETVYQLDVPLEQDGALETAFQVMQQWAEAIAFDPEAIERERGVVIEEQRLGRGAARRMFDQHSRVLFAGSRYADRFPIGTLEGIESFEREDFVAFYRRWYRPDNMAIIAVGDVPVARLRELAARELGSIEAPQRRLRRRTFRVRPRGDLQVSVASDPEATENLVGLYVPTIAARQDRRSDYRAALIEGLYATILNERLRELSRDPDAPLLSAGLGGAARFIRPLDLRVANAIAKQDRGLEALELLARELARAAQFGFRASELERARARFVQSIEEAFVNRETRPMADLADELVRHWTTGEPVPGIETEFELYRAILPSVTLDDLKAVAQAWAAPDGAVVLAGLRSGEQRIPDQAEFLAAVRAGYTTPLRESEALEDDAALMPNPPDPRGARVVAYHEAVEVSEIELENGVRVLVKPTDFSEDEVLISMYSAGGLALVDDSDVVAARLALAVGAQSGVARLDAAALERALAGASSSVTLSLGRTDEGLRAAGRVQDLELTFQLIHQYLTAPRFDQRALERVVAEQIEKIRSAQAAPQGRYARRFQELYANGDPRLAPLVAEQLQRVRVADLARVYAQRFSTRSDMVFTVVGSVTTERVRELAARYLATLAPAGEPETIPPASYRPPERTVSEVVRAGSEAVALYTLVLHGGYRWSRTENYLLSSLATLVETRLREELREAAGGTYSVGAGTWRFREPEPLAFVSIGFGLDPARLEELRARTQAVIDELIAAPVDTDYVTRIQAGQRSRYDEDLQSNAYWRSTIEFSARHGRDLNQITAYGRLIDQLDATTLQQTAERYLRDRNRLEVVLLPEE